MTTPRVFALIPAAGQSRRMGQPKLLLPVAGQSLIARVVSAFRQAGIAPVLVVTTVQLPAVAEAAAAAGACVLSLPQPTQEMRHTILAGLDWLETHCQPAPTDAWFLTPGDQPSITPSLIHKLLIAWQKHAECSIFVPCHAGMRGHPVLISWRHVSALRRWPAGQGFNIYLRSQESTTFLLPVAAEEWGFDVDTPADYDRLRQHFSSPDG
jgi:molybdenum cofactor cytidylyltransferase